MTNQIRVLPPAIAERIAAGEVVERPASVVKELIENSLDAGSTEIAVTLEDGGKSLIEVIDNGIGMSPEDLEVCIERHATSKLNCLEDLENILTLGFRGEALASISAVSDVTLTSRQAHVSTAYELHAGDLAARTEKKCRSKKTTFGHFLHSPHGTRIQARGIFSQIPARLKFLKSQAAEVSQVRECMEKLSLAYPTVGFRLVSDHRTLFHLKPQDEFSRIRALLSDGEDFPLVTATNESADFEKNELQIRLHWIQGLSSPQSRKLIQIVNSRIIRDRMLQHAILNPFKQTLLPGQYPAVVLWMKVNPASIDVNVHPTKMEIRFLEHQKIFKSIDSLVRSLILQKGAPAIATLSLPQESRTEFSESPFFAPHSPLPIPLSEITPAEQEPSYHRAEENLSLPSKSYPFQFTKQVGLLFHTYLIYEDQDEMILVDQHAAHERITYEKLRKRVLHTSSEGAHSQALLLPEVVKFPANQRPLLENRLIWMTQLGFETEIFGEDSLVFRSIPAEWGTYQLKIRLKNLLDRTLHMAPTDGNLESPFAPNLAPLLAMDEALFEKLASEACHSSVRAGDKLEPLEAQALVEQLFHCEHPWNCPHGRPTIVKIPQGKLEEWFHRKI